MLGKANEGKGWKERERKSEVKPTTTTTCQARFLEKLNASMSLARSFVRWSLWIPHRASRKVSVESWATWPDRIFASIAIAGHHDD